MQPKSSHPSVILHNGVVFTADPKQRWGQAVAVQDNQILAVGTDDEVLPLAGPQTKIINVQGRADLPGFNDAHTHYIEAAIREASTFSMFGVVNREQAAGVIRHYAELNPSNDWLLGKRLDLGRFENGVFPNRHILDGIENRRPVAITDIDGHSCWVNSKALHAMGYTADTPDPVGGRILREADGTPNGMLLEEAYNRVPAPVLPAGMDFRQVMRSAGARLNRMGITSLSNNGIEPEHLDVLDEMARQGELAFRLNEWPALEENLEYAHSLRERFAGNEQIRVTGLKLFMDGVLSSRTAWLLEPYSDEAGNCGFPMQPVEEMDALALQADRAGFQVITHAIGDRGVREMLNIYEHAAQMNGRRDSRHRVEHIEMAHPQDQIRFGSLGVIASMQPLHATACIDDYTLARIGAERGAYSYPWQSLLNGGAHLCFGTDWPAIDMSRPNPLENIYGAVTRCHPGIKGMPPFHIEQGVSLEQAIISYTTEPAYAEFMEARKGTLTPGKLADVRVLDRNIFSMPPEDLLSVGVSLTMANGNIVYQQIE